MFWNTARFEKNVARPSLAALTAIAVVFFGCSRSDSPKPDPAPSQNWQRESINVRGFAPVLRLDAAGRPSVAYLTQPSSDRIALNYASRGEGAWSSEEVLSLPGSPVGSAMDFRFKPDGTPCAMVLTDTFGKVIVACRKGDRWEKRELAWNDNPTATKLQTSFLALALSQEGTANLLIEGENGVLLAGWNPKFHLERLSPVQNPLNFHLASDEAGALHGTVTRYTGPHERSFLHFAWRGTAVSSETVADGETFGNHVRIAFDSTGTPHLLYSELHGTGIGVPEYAWYARLEAMQWKKERLGDDRIISARQLGLRIDTKGVVHALIAGESLLVYRRREATWTAETVAAEGRDVSLAVDPNGTPHAIYSIRGEFQYAKRASP